MLAYLRRSLANQIAVIISLILVVIFALIGIVLFNFTYNQLLDNKKTETYLRSQSISKDVQYIFENAKLVTIQTALHPELRAYVRTVVDKKTIRDNPYYLTAKETLRKIRESSPIHLLVSVANEKANFYLDSDGYIPDDSYVVKIRPWYAVGMAARDVGFTSPYVEWKTKKIIISSIGPIRENGQVTGFVILDIVLEKIPAIFESAKINTADKSFLVTADGQYIYHDDPSRTMKTNINDMNDPLHPYKDQIIKGTQQMTEVDYSGKKYYLVTYGIKEAGWTVVTLIDKLSIQNRIASLGAAIFLGLGLAIVGTISLVGWAVRRSIRPYGAVIAFANDIASGDFTKNIPQEYINRPDEMGSLSRSFQIIIDAFRSETVILEEKIKDKNLELESQYQFILETEKAASLGNLVAGVAHEINTPLGVSLTTASYLKKINDEQRKKLADGQMSRDDLKELMSVVNESVTLLDHNLNRAAELVKSFKQVAVDQSSGTISEFNLKENIDGVIISLRHEYKNMPVTISNHCPTDLNLKSYPGAFSQIFTNLIMNSLQHGLVKSTHGEINIDAFVLNQVLKIIYMDNGVGISKENLKKIYDPFFTTNRQKGNSGLGMHIIINIVTQRLKGTLRCESEEGEGVRFTFEIPCDGVESTELS